MLPIFSLGQHAREEFLNHLPAEGVLFPYLSGVRVGDRAGEFGQRYRQLGVPCVTLPLYCYARAERAKAAGCPERFAQAARGRNSKAKSNTYPNKILMTIRSLEDYEDLLVENLGRRL